MERKPKGWGRPGQEAKHNPILAGAPDPGSERISQLSVPAAQWCMVLRPVSGLLVLQACGVNCPPSPPGPSLFFQRLPTTQPKLSPNEA